MPSLNDAIKVNRNGLVPVEPKKITVGFPPNTKDFQPVFNPLMRCPLPGSLVDSLRQFYRKGEIPQSRLISSDAGTQTIGGSQQSGVSASGSSVAQLASGLSASVTTSIIPPGQQYFTSIDLAKAFLVLNVSVNDLARVQLYSTSDAQLADAGRAAVSPLSGSQHGVILDLYPLSISDINWIMSPAAYGANQDDPQLITIYITITNLSTNSDAFTVGINYVPLLVEPPPPPPPPPPFPPPPPPPPPFPPPPGGTVTLASLTDNNTSASSSWKTDFTGDAVPSCISNVDPRKLLYGLNGIGVTTKFYSHQVDWFTNLSNPIGQPVKHGHINVGYNSNTQAQVNAIIADHLRRHFNGSILDWYGQPTITGDNGRSDQIAAKYISRAEQLGNYEFAICIDKGAVSTDKIHSGTDTSNFLAQLIYVNATYFSSSAYMKKGGRPILLEFGLEKLDIDWAAARATMAANGNPLFIFQDKQGFTNGHSDGAFSWVGNSAATPIDPEALNYLRTFYNNAIANPTFVTFGSVRPGFNDLLANWSENRIMSRFQGQTWKDSFGIINEKYSAANQLYAVQVVTGNDYEEGSETESGIDSDLAFSNFTVVGNVLSWSVTGDESLFDHYEVYSSPDGQNLTLLASLSTTTHTFNISGSGLTSGASYGFWIYAVGINSMKNVLSSKVISIVP